MTFSASGFLPPKERPGLLIRTLNTFQNLEGRYKLNISANSNLASKLLYKSGDQLCSFGEITLDKKYHATVLLSAGVGPWKEMNTDLSTLYRWAGPV